MPNRCPSYTRLISTVWTHSGTGIMKYVQWIVTRKLGNVQISILDDRCEIVQEDYFSSDPDNDNFVQIYILSLLMDLSEKSRCSIDLPRIINGSSGKRNQIYFKRRSVEATVVYEHLDKFEDVNNLTIHQSHSFYLRLGQANLTMKHFMKFFTELDMNHRLTIIHAEDIVPMTLTDAEKALKNLLALLGFVTGAKHFQDVIQYDRYQFLRDATWWDQSEVAKYILSTWFDQKPENLDKSHDYYHLNGNLSFSRYVSDNRRCYRHGIFYQMQSETSANRTTRDALDRCAFKKFDCAFSDLYSFGDREELYRRSEKSIHFYAKPIKCGFAIPSVLDRVRERYEHNHTCQIVVFTCITNCYDPLPVIEGPIPAGTCFVALADTKTMLVFKHDFSRATRFINQHIPWDFIDLGPTEALFRVAAKITETVKTQGHRMFPLASWFVWLDGKAYIINLPEVLSRARTPIIGLRHTDFNRTSQSEVELTVLRVIHGGISDFVQFNRTVEEIRMQEAEYNRDGFYNRSVVLGLGLFDIAIFMYRNNYPCSFRYLCGWHNEINYYSYRGQLSVYYPAERLNLTRYLGFIARSSYHTLAHKTIC